MSLPMTRKMPTTDNDQELHLVNLFPVRRRKSPSGRGVGTNVMKKALSQISKSPFTRGIEKAKLPKRFHQPTFAMYNGRTVLVEHVSQFKQKMAVHS